MDWLARHLWEAWLGLAIVLGVAEMFSLDLIVGMLAIGALVGMVLAIADVHVAIQVLGAAGASIAMLALVRPSMIKKLHSGPELELGHGKLVGTQGIVVTEMSGLTTGRIKIGGEDWSARPYDDTMTIPAGETVEVLAIKGATAYVHPVARLDY
ncbi:NfeD family protein [Nocardioides terrigena]|jgi:membrane protein implicated in regulation of membrane protease activity|uniref:NfeD family protein n=1 Tax=Nocardioides terrigena TaxID=424797 RepID=UPI000D2FF46D|nr:NfeD family protein [Nocardioides terrigena]